MRLLAALLFALAIAWAMVMSARHEQRGLPAPAPSQSGFALPDHLTLREPTWSRVDDRLDISVDVGADVESFLLMLALTNREASIGLLELVSPDGSRMHHEDVDDETGFDSRISAVSYFSTGELALYLPLNEKSLAPGRWQATYALDADAELRRVDLLMRAANATAEPRKLSVAFGVTNPDARLLSDVSQRALADALRSDMDQILRPHDLAVGNLDFHHDRTLATAAVLDVDGWAFADACAALVAAMDDPLALPVLLVDHFTSGEDEDIGNTIGSSPLPGTILDSLAADSCAAVALDALLPEDDSGYDESTVLGQFSATVLHEAGHFMGLEHSTEADGLVFDRLDDTRECTIALVDGRDNVVFDVAGERDGIADDFECDVAGGASNLMFWAGVAEFAPFTLSRSQAAVLRRHPLFR